MVWPTPRDSTSGRDSTIGIVTALAIEYAAVRAVVDDPRPTRIPQDPNEYVCATLPSATPGHPHRVAVVLLVRDGTRSASAAGANLLRSFPDVRTVVLSGVAGGVPRPDDPDRHVDLGDVVVATEVVDYDHLRQTDGVATLRRPVSGLSHHLLGCAQRLGAVSLRVPVPQPADHGQPRIHFGKVASADRLVRDEHLRDDLARAYGVCAIEMEAAGIAAAVDSHGRHWFVVRGISDHCDRAKTKNWQPYAAHAAAAYTRKLLAASPGPAGGRAPTTLDRMGLVELLLRIPALVDAASRQVVVERLRPTIRHNIRRHQTARLDVHEILSTCLDYEGGPAELIDAIRAVAGDSLSLRAAAEAL